MSDKSHRSERVEPKGGTVVADRYQVDRLIARGGMAAVYLAHHVKLNRPVALKILSPPPDAEDQESFEERFRLEAETLASLDHANIVILHDFGETSDGRFFLAMEYVDGQRLTDLLKDGPLPPDRALNLILQVCAALRYAHKRGVVHRDLKPSNLLIRTKDNGEEQVKVVDFGLVKLTEADQSITRAGLILGSPHCMAPEQIKGLDVDHRADVYAIGILLFRTLTGQYPFHGANSAATMIAHLNQPVPTFFSMAPDLVVPVGLEEIVRKCLAKKPDDRYADMHELIGELAACMHIPAEQFKSVSQTHSTIERALSGPAPRKTGLWIAGALAAAAIATVAAVAIGIVALSATRPGDAQAAATQPVVEPAPTTPPEPIDPPAPEVTAQGTPEPEAPVPVQPAVEPRPEQPKTVPSRPKKTAQSSQPPKQTQATPEPAEPAPAETTATPEGYMGLPPDL